MAKKPINKTSGHPTGVKHVDQAMKFTHGSGKKSARKPAPTKKMAHAGRTTSY